MKSEKNVGRLIGVLLVVQMLAEVLINLVLLGPVITVAPGFLVNAAANSLQVSLAVLIGLMGGALSVGIAITALPVFRQYSYAMALWILALAIVGFSLAVVENSAVMSMLSLSKAHAKANAADAALFETLRVVVASARNWAHYTHLLVGGGMFLVFYSLLYRFALIPRVLAGFGLIAVSLQMTAVAMPLFGYPVMMLMLMPVGLAHLSVALWLSVRGFETKSLASRPTLASELPRRG
ncbi:MAG: DUF4386 domain-containing protein [Steroidobacter sp.]